MTIQGGGGNRPPGGPPTPPKTPNGSHKGRGKAVRTAQRSAASEKAADTKAKQAARDSFATKARPRGALEGHRRVEEIVGKMPTTTSGIENMVKILEATRTQIAEEYAEQKERAATIVARLVEARFSVDAVALAAHELRELRARMAQLRRRLNEIHRRLRVAFSTAGKLGYANLAQRLGAQMERVQKLEPGVQRALLALELAEQLYGRGEAGMAALRAPMSADSPAPRATVGSYLAAIAPSAAIARRAASMLTAGPAAAHDAAALPAFQELHDRARAGDADATLDAFAAFHDALLGAPRS